MSSDKDMETGRGPSVHMLIRKVDLLTLRLVLATIEERQISRAATLENIAATAVTKRIQDLEEMLGVKLFERNPKGVAPSKAGQQLAKRLREIFASLEQIRQEMGEFADGVRGHVRVAATGTIIVQHLADEIGAFVRSFPFLDVEIHENLNLAVLRALRTGEVEVGVFLEQPGADYDGLATSVYRESELVVACPIGHHFAEKGFVNTTDILDARFIGIEPSTAVMDTLRGAARRRGRELRPKYSVAHLEAARSLVKAGLGVTICPRNSLSLADFDRIATVSIAEPWASCRWLIAALADQPRSPAASLLIEQLSGHRADVAD